MTEYAKATEYRIKPLTKMLRAGMNTDGGTQKKAEALEGTWVRLNEYEYVLEEAGAVTRVYSDGDHIGCACGRCDVVLCEHIIAFEALKSPPQITIESSDYRWLRTYLLGLNWYPDNRYLYPPMGDELPEDKASLVPDEDKPSIEPEVVAELPPIDESPKLDPMNEDKPLDIGVDDEPEPKRYSRKCGHHGCGYIEVGEDKDLVIFGIAEHRRTCQLNPANKKRKPSANVPKKPDSSKPTAAKSATVEEPPKEEEKKVKPSSKKFTCEICGTEYDSADDALNCIEKCKEARDLESTKALIAQDTAEDEDWSNSQIEVMRKTVAEKATPEEFAYFLNVAKYTGLNPFLREIYFMKTEKGQTAIITGRDGYLTIAKRDPRFMGIHSMEVCEKDVFEMSFEEGKMAVSKHVITDFADRGEIIGAWACGRMDRQDTVTIFASMKEYDKSSNSTGGKIWKQYTSSMIRKVAESMVLKRIAGISGLVTEAEMQDSGEMVLDAEVV